MTTGFIWAQVRELIVFLYLCSYKLVGSVTISASPDPEAAGSASPDPWVYAPPRPTPRPRAPPRSGLGFAFCLTRPSRAGSASPKHWFALRLIRPLRGTPPRPTPRPKDPSRPTETHTTANHSRSKRMGQGQNSDTKEETGMPRCNPWP